MHDSINSGTKTETQAVKQANYVGPKDLGLHAADPEPVEDDIADSSLAPAVQRRRLRQSALACHATTLLNPKLKLAVAKCSATDNDANRQTLLPTTPGRHG